MSKHIINISDGIGYSKPVVNQFSSGFDSIQFVLDLNQDVSSYSFALAVSVCGDCFMIIEDTEHFVKGIDTSTGKTYLDWTVGKNVTAKDGVVTYQIIAYTANEDGTFKSMWYSPEGRLVVGESISLTEYETAEIGAKPSVLMQVLAKATANETKALANQEEIKSHKESLVIDHPDKSVITEKIADKAVTSEKIADESITKDKVAIGAIGISKLDADLTALVNSFANAELVKNEFDILSQAVETKVDKESGKGLSTNDFTDTLREKLNLLPDGASITEQFNTLEVDVANKVDKESGKGLSANDFTDTLKEKLTLLPNSTSISSRFNTLSQDVANKVDKETGKGLSENDFTDTLKEKLTLLPDSTAISSKFNAISQNVANKVDKETGKGLSENDFTDTLKEKLTLLPDSTAISEQFNTLSQNVANKVDKESGKVLSTNDFTDILKEKLDLLPDANSISIQFDTLSQDVENKVEKEEGRGLSSNDFTDELKLKLDSLPDANSPDLNLGNVSQRLKDLNDFSKKNYANSIKSSAQGKIIHVEDACPIEHIVSVNVNLENATETVEGANVYVCGKNLLNFANINGDVQGTYRGWLVNPEEQTITVSMSDRDTSVDISGVYLGICNTGVDGSGGIIWLIEKGTIKRTSYSLNRKYISVYRSGTLSYEEAIEKLTQRFYIQVEFGSEATSYEDFKGGKYEITQNEIDALSPAAPTMYIYSDVPGATIECQYNLDTKSYIDNKISALEEAIANINSQLLQQ